MLKTEEPFPHVYLRTYAFCSGPLRHALEHFEQYGCPKKLAHERFSEIFFINIVCRN